MTSRHRKSTTSFESMINYLNAYQQSQSLKEDNMLLRNCFESSVGRNADNRNALSRTQELKAQLDQQRMRRNESLADQSPQDSFRPPTECEYNALIAENKRLRQKFDRIEATLKKLQVQHVELQSHSMKSVKKRVHEQKAILTQSRTRIIEMVGHPHYHAANSINADRDDENNGEVGGTERKRA